jgi:hypothetical protein
MKDYYSGRVLIFFLKENIKSIKYYKPLESNNYARFKQIKSSNYVGFKWNGSDGHADPLLDPSFWSLAMLYPNF